MKNDISNQFRMKRLAVHSIRYEAGTFTANTVRDVAQIVFNSHVYGLHPVVVTNSPAVEPPPNQEWLRQFYYRLYSDLFTNPVERTRGMGELEHLLQRNVNGITGVMNANLYRHYLSNFWRTSAHIQGLMRTGLVAVLNDDTGERVNDISYSLETSEITFWCQTSDKKGIVPLRNWVVEQRWWRRGEMKYTD